MNKEYNNEHRAGVAAGIVGEFYGMYPFMMAWGEQMQRQTRGGDPHQLDHLPAHSAARGRSRIVSTHRDIHLGLLQLLGNQRLVDAIEALRDQTRMRGLPTLTQGSAREHDMLLGAREAGDSKRARSVMFGHLEQTRGVWAGHVERSPD